MLKIKTLLLSVLFVNEDGLILLTLDVCIGISSLKLSSLAELCKVDDRNLQKRIDAEQHH